jgi:hypothetical protein
MARTKYLYDVELARRTTNRKIKTILSEASGDELKKFRKSLKTKKQIDDRLYRIYRISTTKKGRRRELYDTVEYGIEHSVRKVLQNRDFQYSGVEIDYDMAHDCEEHGCDYICRCGRITNIRIESIDKSYIASTIGKEILKELKTFKLNMSHDILAYCLDRVLRHLSLDESCFDIQYGSGYYGDEIYGIKYSGSNDLVRDIAILARSSSSMDALRFALEREYGYLLNILRDAKSCKIIEARPSDLVVPNKDHYMKLDKKAIEGYKKEDFSEYPVGVFIGIEGKYRVIDGYHRCFALNSQKKVKSCKIVVIDP